MYKKSYREANPEELILSQKFKPDERQAIKLDTAQRFGTDLLT